MNGIMRIITKLCNIQRDKHLNPPEQPVKKSKQGTGFDQVLREEQKRLKEGN